MRKRYFAGWATLLTLGIMAAVPMDVSYADTPTPLPDAPVSLTPAAPAAPSASTDPTPTPTSPRTPDPSPTPAFTPTPTPTSGAEAEAEAAASLTLAVGSADGPVPNAFYQELGSFVFSGRVDGVPNGAVIEIYRRTASSGFTRVATTTVSGGTYSVKTKVVDAGTFTFKATSAGGPEPKEGLESNLVTVTVADSRIVLDQPVAKIDSLKNPKVAGSIVPARAGVKIHIDVLVGKKYQAKATTTTDTSGRFSTTLGYGKGNLATYSIRTAYRAVNADRWETSNTRRFTRIAVVNAKIYATTAADVAKTYHKGCPVGRSKLKTVAMNYYGRDKRMHRGLIIVRSDLTTEIVRGFTKALDHRYPVAKMNNPNVYGGNDPKQMEANNTSGFNCRKVVGNPYAQSPHSYGIAIDVNTVQNPYRDANGKWWPKSGKSYIDRTPRRWGMLVKNSYLTASLRKDHFFWGGFWNPGRDYQHFQYTK